MTVIASGRGTWHRSMLLLRKKHSYPLSEPSFTHLRNFVNLRISHNFLISSSICYSNPPWFCYLQCLPMRLRFINNYHGHCRLFCSKGIGDIANTKEIKSKDAKVFRVSSEKVNNFDFSSRKAQEPAYFKESESINIKSLLQRLTMDEKREIVVAIQLEDAAEVKKDAEAKLASFTWRSKFGRPTSVQPSQVDPTGTYCEIPQEWLNKKVAEDPKLLKPSFAVLRKIAVFNALPFVGFGFLDNLIMIVAGDYIDLTIGIYLGISTMAAAALGNTISDLAGIGSASYVEFLFGKIGVRPPELSYEQENMASTRWTANIGRGIGVCVGCLLGMFPLFFLPNHSKEERKKEKEKKRKEIEDGINKKKQEESR